MAEQNPNPNGEQNIDIQAEIEKARKQERDKLHADIDRLKNELAEKAKTCNENYITISNLQKELGSAKKERQEFENKLAKAKEDGKDQFSFQSQRKTMPKNVQTTTQLHSSHTLAKQCSKFSKPDFNSM